MTHAEFVSLVAKMRAAQVRLFCEPSPRKFADSLALERQVDRHLKELARPLNLMDFMEGRAVNEG